MLRLAFALLVIALLGAWVGFGGTAGAFVGLTRMAFFVFLVLAVLAFLGGGFVRRFCFWEWRQGHPSYQGQAPRLSVVPVRPASRPSTRD